MSATKRTSLERPMFINNYKLVIRTLRIMLPAAVVLAVVWPVSGAAISWDANGAAQGTLPASILWSTANNWNPNTTPSVADDVSFANPGAMPLTTPPTVTNVVDHSITINSLVYAPTLANYAQTTRVDPSILMKIQGSVAAPTTADGNVSFWACAAVGGCRRYLEDLIHGRRSDGYFERHRRQYRRRHCSAPDEQHFGSAQLDTRFVGSVFV